MTSEPEFLTAARAFYDAIAADYSARYHDDLVQNPYDRAMLTTFTELVRSAGAPADGPAGPIADLGCGEGRLTAHLASLGLEVFGVDLSPGMLAQARKNHPGLRFEEGSLLALDIPDASLSGALAWYSIIHTPREQLPRVFAEFHRVLAPGAHLILAFQVGDQPLHLTDPFGHPVALDFRRRRPEDVTALLSDAGLHVHAHLIREPEEGKERTQQAYLLARKPVG